MVRGFNNSIKIKDEVFDIQTEDSGTKNPVISTLVFKDGMVVFSKKTSYADILKFEKLETAVKEVMREQHLAAIKALETGLYLKATKDSSESIGKGVKEVLNKNEEGGKGIDEIILSYIKPEKEPDK